MEVMDQICSRPLAVRFLSSDNQSDDESPTSKSTEKNLDLLTINKRLKSNKYKSVHEWKSEVERLWTNSLHQNKNSTLVISATLELQKQFRELTKFLTDSDATNWKLELIQMHQELSVCIREMLKLRSASANPQKSQRPVCKRDQLYPTLEELPPAHCRRHFAYFSREDLIRLANDINSIKQESQLALISELLKKQEPDIVDDLDQMEIDINLLKPSTIRLIRDKVDQIIHC